jgi:hypothetical protein
MLGSSSQSPTGRRGSLRALLARISGSVDLEQRLLLLGILAALLMPLLVAQRGLELTPLEATDQVEHLLRLDRLTKARLLDDETRRSPWYQALLGHKLKWPEGVYHVARPLVEPLGLLSIRTTRIVNLLFALLLALGVVGLGRAAGDTTLGLWALLLVLLAPPLAASQWYFGLDYPLLGMTAVGLLLLWHTRGFRRLLPSLGFGAWSALGTACKPTYPIYLLAPALWMVVRGLRGGPGRARVMANATLGGALCLALATPLLGLDWEGLKAAAVQHMTTSATPAGRYFDRGTITGLLAYPLFAVMAFPAALLALPGVLGLHLRRAHPSRGLWLATLWGTFALLTLIPAKLERYLHPIYVITCLALVWGAYRFLRGRWRPLALTSTALIFACSQVWSYFSPAPLLLESAEEYRQSPVHKALDLPPYHELDGRFEIRMPRAEVLDGLRRQFYHPVCDLRPIVRCAARLSRAAPPGQVIVVTHHESTGTPAPPPPLKHLPLALMVAHHCRQRVFAQVPEVRELVPVWREGTWSPVVLVSHTTPVPWERLLPGAEVLAQERVQLVCDRTHTVRLTLLGRGSHPLPASGN